MDAYNDDILMHVANEAYGGVLFGYGNRNLACPTCKVYIPLKYSPVLQQPSELELDVLDELSVLSEYTEQIQIRMAR